MLRDRGSGIYARSNRSLYKEDPEGVEDSVVARKRRRVRGNPSNRGINRLSLALRFCADPDPKVTSCPSRGEPMDRKGQVSCRSRQMAYTGG